jgi:hypothetical protein
MPVLKEHNTFIEELWDKNESYREGKFTIFSRYINTSSAITVKDRYGLGSMSPQNLLQGRSPSLKSAWDKTSYFRKKAEELHSSCDFSSSIYIRGAVKVQVKCFRHGLFYKRANKLLTGEGCPLCGNEKVSLYQINNPSGHNFTNWVQASKKSKNFDSYKVYLIRCDKNQEDFYKVGITFNTLSKRFNCKKALPYNYEIVDIIISTDPKKVWDLENNFKKMYKKYKYEPSIHFHGMGECFRFPQAVGVRLDK